MLISSRFWAFNDDRNKSVSFELCQQWTRCSTTVPDLSMLESAWRPVRSLTIGRVFDRSRVNGWIRKWSRYIRGKERCKTWIVIEGFFPFMQSGSSMHLRSAAPRRRYWFGSGWLPRRQVDRWNTWDSNCHPRYHWPDKPITLIYVLLEHCAHWTLESPWNTSQAAQSKFELMEEH